MHNRMILGACALSLAAAACGDEDPNDTPNTETQTLSARFDNLPELGAEFLYEGWLITPDGAQTAGRFDAASSFDFEASTAILEAATAYVLTIEPRENDDPAPSDTHIAAGALADGQADLSSAHSSAIGTAFEAVSGGFILETPTSAEMDDFANGVWFLDPAAGPGPSLTLPTLAAGWAYEGWVVVDGSPVSTGRFTAVDAADEDGAGPDAGSEMAPPFPGQDFVSPAVNLAGATVVISVEPSPDDSAAPFFLKPLVGAESLNQGGVLQSVSRNDDARLITGSVSYGVAMGASS